MRLIKAETLRLETFDNEDHIPRYAILSHRWLHGQEVLFQDIVNHENDGSIDLQGWSKIKNCCARALDDGIEYVWIDTCCINKESSAELSEAINSMFRWYRSADRCYAYLNDVELNHETPWKVQFTSSAWFERAWTLQELIAPLRLEFFDRKWMRLGSRSLLVNEISQASGIHKNVFADACSELSKWSVAQRMSWASGRVATRTEDVAYSLLGIFDVNMPLLYGEGRKAFLRLQEEIIRRTHDHSIFAWSSSTDVTSEHGMTGILASSPKAFQQDGGVLCYDFARPSAYSLTNLGLQIELRLKPWAPRVYLAGLNCSRNYIDQIGIFIIKRAQGPGVAYRVTIDGRSCSIWGRESGNRKTELVTIATQIQALAAKHLEPAIGKPCMQIALDIGSLMEPNKQCRHHTISCERMDQPKSYKRTSSFSCLTTARSHCENEGDGVLTIHSLLSSKAPCYGTVCILMYPLGNKHISAIKFGIDTNCNPVCILADDSNEETQDGTPRLDHCGSPVTPLLLKNFHKNFWQWDCLEQENWSRPSDDELASGSLFAQSHPPYLTPGLWTVKGRYDKSSFFRLRLGISDRDSIVIKLGLEKRSKDEIRWTFSIDWS